MDLVSKSSNRAESRLVQDATKAQIRRVLAELSERSVSANESSRDFYLRSARWVAGMKSVTNHELRMECLERCAKYFYQIADRRLTIEVVVELDRLATASGNKSWIRKAKSYLGIAHADRGDLYASLASYSKALVIARELRDKFAESIVLSNMGSALMTAGLYTDSMRAFERAFDIGISEPALVWNACCSATNMALVSFRQARHEAGVQHLQDALRLEPGFPPEQYDLHRVILEQVYVQLAVGLGDPRLAQARLKICEEYALRAGSKRARLIAALARGLWEVEYGSCPVGIGLLRSAVESALPRTDEWVEGHLLLIRSLERTGDVQEALDFAERLASGLAEMSHFGAQALLNESELQGFSLRPDGLDRLALQRSRLEAKAARRYAMQMQRESIERLAMVAELRADSSGLHGHRVGKLSGALARYLQFDYKHVEQIEVAGRLHDIGKVAIPERVLFWASKPGSAEHEVLKAHARLGGDLLAQSSVPELRCAEIVARHHHERWDGEGYPSNMAGKRIPIECRIVAIADYFDALTQGRANEKALAPELALADISLQAGSRFDPDLCSSFCALISGLSLEQGSIARFLESDVKTSSFANAIGELNDLLAEVPEVRDRELARGRAAVASTGVPSKRFEEPL